ncbi:MAG TPA: hypothetical protein ENK57_12025 [Polyangiaceae bacterium]|nr:hypothetical protein [Polyangiaceae bacterium]
MGTLATLDDLAPGVELAALPPAQIVDYTHALDEIHVRQARGIPWPLGSGLEHLPVGPAALVEYAIADESTGQRIENADFHEAWHDFFDRESWGVIEAPVGHGKTNQIPIGRTIYELGKNPSLRFALCCATYEQASDRVDAIRQHIDTNVLVRKVFPGLYRARRRGAPWGSKAIEVERKTRAKDASVTAFGVGSKAITGGRFDRMLLDDVVDEQTSATEEQREKLTTWWDRKASTRLPVTGKGRILAIGTPWARGDLLDLLGGRPDFGRQVWSAVTNPDDDPMEWGSLWAHMTPAELRKRYANMLPSSFFRMYCCRISDPKTKVFQAGWIKWALQQGVGRTFLDAPPARYIYGPTLPCFTGVDVGVGREERHNRSSIVTIALLPDRRRLVVDMQSGRWTGPELVSRIMGVGIRFGSEIAVESNAAQRFLVDFIEERQREEFTVEAHYTTGANKRDLTWGLESVAVELRAGRWVFPSNDLGQPTEGELRALIVEMDEYRPTEHTGDRLMALWIAREQARRFSPEEELEVEYADLQER